MWYLKSAFETYQKLQNSIQGGLSEVQSAALSPLSVMKRFVEGAVSQRPTEESELDQLKKRLTEVEANMKEKKAHPPKRRKTTS